MDRARVATVALAVIGGGCAHADVVRLGPAQRAAVAPAIAATPGVERPCAPEDLACVAARAVDPAVLELAAPASSPPRATCAAAQCYDGFRASGEPLANVASLGDACGRACGLAPMTKAYVVDARGDDAPRVFAIDLDAATCYRAFAVGDDGVRVLRAALVDARGRVVSIDNSSDRAPILGPREPFCPSAGGRHRLVVGVARGEGRFAFQIWSAPRRAEGIE